MDTRKHYGAETEQDTSDDLIAELARLVGDQAPNRDQRNAAERAEPQLTPATPPQDTVTPEPRMTAPAPRPQDASAAPAPRAERTEPSLGAPEPDRSAPTQGERGDAFEFDFGFGTHTQATPQPAPEPEEPEADPIGNLIADADAEAARTALESDAENEPRISDPAPEPQQTWQETGSVSARFAGVPNEPQDQRVDAPEPGEPASARDSQIRDRDPLSEIEALIGQAARVNLDSGPMGTRRVRSVYANDGSESEASEADVETAREQDTPQRQRDAAEEAILAAAAATGASVNRVERDTPVTPEAGRAEPDFDFTPSTRSAPAAEAEDDTWDDSTEADPAVAPAARPKRRRRYRQPGMMMPALIGSLIVAGVAGGYFVFFGNETTPGEAPVLVADSEPAKSVPEATNTTGTTNESVVFSDMEGSANAATASSQLVSRDQTEGATGSAVSNIIAPEDGDSGLVNRRVRTVTVRPDGTIVSGDAAEAGSSVLPVDRPNVPQVASGATEDDPIGAAITQAMSGGSGTGLTTQSTNASADTTQDVASAAAVDSLPGLDSDAGTGATENADAAASTETGVPLPSPRPAESGNATPSVASLQEPLEGDTAATDDPGTEDVAAVEPETTTEAAATPRSDIPVIGAWVQLSSQRTEEAARQGIPELEARYGDLFNGTQPVVDRADLGNDGVFYRVRLPQPNFEEATSVCNAIKAQGGDCFVLNG